MWKGSDSRHLISFVFGGCALVLSKNNTNIVHMTKKARCDCIFVCKTWVVVRIYMWRLTPQCLGVDIRVSGTF